MGGFKNLDTERLEHINNIQIEFNTILDIIEHKRAVLKEVDNQLKALENRLNVLISQHRKNNKQNIHIAERRDGYYD